MGQKTLAHLSDLHFGASAAHEAAAFRLRDALIDGEIDHAIVTGDVTHRGRKSELQRFFAVFAPLIREGRLSVVPGNHDRLGDDVAAALMEGARVEVTDGDGLHMVRVDSTGPHNRILWAGHGEIDDAVLADVDAALARAPSEKLVVLALHHHPLPLPEESLPERLSTRLGWPYAAELRLGAALLEVARGRCNLVLHGHRHLPREQSRFGVGVYNAGCSTALGRFRVFAHAGGALAGVEWWQAEALAATA